MKRILLLAALAALVLPLFALFAVLAARGGGPAGSLPAAVGLSPTNAALEERVALLQSIIRKQHDEVARLRAANARLWRELEEVKETAGGAKDEPADGVSIPPPRDAAQPETPAQPEGTEPARVDESESARRDDDALKPSEAGEPPVVPEKYDETPPAISESEVRNISETEATVSWETDERADGTVRYGLEPGKYSFFEENLRFFNRHGIALENLLSDRIYYYVIVSKDGAGNEETTSEQTFRTLPLPTPSGNTHSISLDNGTYVRQFLSVPDENANSLDVSEAITIEAWIKPANLETEAVIAGKDSETRQINERSYSLLVGPDGLRFHAVAYEPQTFTSHVEKNWTSAYNFKSGEWVHVAVTHDTQPKFYINGVPFSAAPSDEYVGHGINKNYLDFTVGANDEGETRLMSGLADEVRIWNVVRTSREILSHFRKEIAGDERGLVGYWQFDEVLADERIYDSSPQGNHLVPEGDPSFATDTPF